jgi:hypothetical protein
VGCRGRYRNKKRRARVFGCHRFQNEMRVAVVLRSFLPSSSSSSSFFFRVGHWPHVDIAAAARARFGSDAAAARGRPVRLAYQPPANSTFLSEQTSHQQPASSTFLSEQTSTSHQPTAKLLHCINDRGLRSSNGRIGGPREIIRRLRTKTLTTFLMSTSREELRKAIVATGPRPGG